MSQLLSHESCDNCGWEHPHAKKGSRLQYGIIEPFIWHFKYYRHRGYECPDCGDLLCNCLWCRYHAFYYEPRKYNFSSKNEFEIDKEIKKSSK